jgi:hypothetical protein
MSKFQSDNGNGSELSKSIAEQGNLVRDLKAKDQICRVESSYCKVVGFEEAIQRNDWI